jgi:uncharacterized protein YjbK
MNTNLEIEYKTLITQQEFNQLLAYFNQYKLINQTNYYYQSTNSLRKKIAARIRQIDSSFELTFKIKQDKGKLEVNFNVPSNSIDHFNRPDVQTFLKSHGYNRQWVFIGELHTTRHLIVEEFGELCIDHNRYLGIEDYELEYEVKHDDEDLAYARFIQILNQFSIKNIKAKAKFHRFILNKFK